MTDYFKTQGRALLGNGYLIIPIKPHSKAPALEHDWPKARLGVSDLDKHPGCGVGVLCGQGANPIRAVDVDTSNPEIAAAFTAWCYKHLGYTCARVGAAPKILLPYRGEGSKITSFRYDGGHRLEILGNGQQFVAYHVHKDTHKPYAWIDMLGGLEEVSAADLPYISEPQMRAAIAEFDRLAVAHDLRPVGAATETVRIKHDDPLAPSEQPIGISIQDARRHLERIDNTDYDTWLKVGMALHHEFEASGTALALWDTWSSTASNYKNEDDLIDRWDGFGRTGAAIVGANWLLKMGKRDLKIERREKTEFGNASRLIDKYGEGLMYVPDLSSWFIWTGIYWRQACAVEMEHLAIETINALPEEIKNIDTDAGRADFFKFCASSQKAAMVGNMLTLAKSDVRVVVKNAGLDADKMLLGVGNGVVDLRTGSLLPAKPEQRITISTNVEYDENAQAPLFRQTVSDVFFDNPEMIEFFQKLIGYSILGDPTEDWLVIPYGCGANGKSTLFGVIQTALGGHAKTVNADLFLTDSKHTGGSGGARPDVLRMRGARFIYVAEPDQNSELKEGIIKAMTGGDDLVARPLYSGNYVQIKPTWTVFIPTNHKPVVKGSDEGIWRRLLPINFERNFRKDLIVGNDIHRAGKLLKELPGVLRWCVEGALKYRAEGIKPPSCVDESRETYKDDMDLLREWIEECCETGRYCADTSANLWVSWEMWARAAGMLQYIKSKNLLTRRLGDRFNKRKGTDNITEFIGIRVKSIG